MTDVTPFELVDGHHHLWDLTAVNYPWLNATGVRRFFGDPTPIQRNYGVADLRADAAPLRIIGSVHIQVGCAPGSEVEETRFLERSAVHDGLPTAIVAAADLLSPDLGKMLQQHLTASSRVRGIRQIIGREPSDDARTGCGAVLNDTRLLTALQHLADADLSFDLQLTVPQMPAVVRLLAQLPSLRVALCHVGSPWDHSPAGEASWRRGLADLSALPNVHCKLSGLSMFNPKWQETEFIDRISAAIDCFGVERCFFGSNFPVDGLHRSYGEIVDATRAAVRGFGADAEARIFRDNARRFYRL